MNKKGFISAYYTVIFIVVLSYIAVFTSNLIDQMYTTMNLEKAQAYQSQENVILSYVKCQLKHESLESGDVLASNVSFYMDQWGQQLTISVYEPYPEEIILTYGEDGTILSMDTNRSEISAS